MRVELELRNLPAAKVMGWLVEAGGERDGERHVAGAGWHATLVPMDDAVITPILHVPRDLLVIEGETDAVSRIGNFMRHKTMRGGG
jgi:hypothetical protein